MLARSHRFHGLAGLRVVYSRGQVVRSSQLNLKFLCRGDRPFRVAVVVSRKVSKSAVVRNRIRRRLYAVIEANQAVLPPGTDVIMTVFQDTLATMPTPNLNSLVIGLLTKAAKTPADGTPNSGGRAIVK